MTEVTTEGTTWIQKRASVFNNNPKATKTVDKELARLKNLGAVSSVWTNKFVQEDNSGGIYPHTFTLFLYNNNNNNKNLGRRQSYPRATTSPSAGSKNSPPPSPKEDENQDVSSPVQAQQHDTCQALLDKAHQDIQFYKSQVAEATEKSKQLEETRQQEAASLWFQCETLKTQFAQTEARLKKAQDEIESYKQQLIDQKEAHQAALQQQHEKSHQEAASLWFQCETLKTDFAHMEARLKRANAEIEEYKQPLSQYEALKVQHEQLEARLNNAHMDIESYKQQLEEQELTYQKALEAEKEDLLKQLENKKDEAASLWFQYESLKTQHAQAEARLHTEIETYKQQLQQTMEASSRYAEAYESLKVELELLKNETSISHPITSNDTLDAEAPLQETSTRSITHLDETKVSNEETPTINDTLLKEAYAQIEHYKHQLEEQKALHDKILAETTQRLEDARKDETAALWFQTEALKTEFAQREARLHKQAAADLAAQAALHEKTLAEKLEAVQSEGKDEAAALWFQCETLKTQQAQLEARLKKTQAESESYQEQVRVLTDENAIVVRRLAQLIVKQDVVLEDYEAKLSTDSGVREQVEALKKEKEAMEQTIVSLRGDLAMNHRQMDLVLAVSTEIQNEFSVYKEEREAQVQRLLEKKDLEWSKKLQQGVAARDKTIEHLKYQLKTRQEPLQLDTTDKTRQEFLYSTDDDSDVLMMSYSDDDDRGYFTHFEANKNQQQEFTDAVSSPVSSTISFNSDENNNDKHFSYVSAKSTTTTSSSSDFIKDIHQRLSSGRLDVIHKESWPIPPPTPPPSDPLPPVPRRVRSRTMGMDDAPDTSIYRTSIHQTNELPKIIPVPTD